MRALKKTARIVHMVGRFSPLSETFIYQLVLGLSDRFPETRVCTLERVNVESRPFGHSDVLMLGWDWYIAGQFNWRRQAIRDWLFTRAFKKYLRRWKPDLVHAHFGGNFLRTVDACHALNIPAIVTFRGYDASARLEDAKWRRQYMEKLSKASAIVAVSEDISKKVSRLLPSGLPVRVVHSGKDPAHYQIRSRQAPVKTLLSVGRLVEKKGHKDAIRAFSFAREAGFQGTLRIIGDGPHRENLVHLVSALNLSESVTFLGSMTHDEVLQEYIHADAFVLTCRTAQTGDQEGIPNTLKEAMLCGLPVISTQHGGIPELVPCGCHGWLVPEGDWRKAGSLILKLATLSDFELQCLGEQYRSRVEQYFSLEAEINQYAKIYAEVLNGHTLAFS